MATHTATLGQLSPSSISATVLKLTPILLAAVLVVGCSTKAQRIGSLSGDPSMAASASGKSRGGTPDAAQPGAANSQTASQGGKESAEGGAGSTGTPSDASGGDNLASKQADASPSSDESATSSSSDGVGGVGSSARDGAGGDQASTMTGGGAAASARPGPVRRAGATTAAAGGQSTPGDAAGSSEASSVSGNGASAGRERAAGARPSDTDAGAADLSSGGSVAGLEGSAAGAPGGKTSATPARRAARNASGASDDGTGTGGAAAAGVEGDSRIAAIDVPSGKLKVDEEYRPQTLGGVLPLVLGVNEEGRFDFDQYSLRPEVKRILDELAEKLKAAEYDRLDIIGYTDRIGTTDYNRRLSELRAYAVAQYLMGRGVPENKVRYEGRGDKDPLTPAGHCRGLAREELITCLQNDRRVEIEASIHRKHATVIQ